MYWGSCAEHQGSVAVVILSGQGMKFDDDSVNWLRIQAVIVSQHGMN
jgi:hypothetical protein